jgi:hypothetical protein
MNTQPDTVAPSADTVVPASAPAPTHAELARQQWASLSQTQRNVATASAGAIVGAIIGATLLA